MHYPTYFINIHIHIFLIVYIHIFIYVSISISMSIKMDHVLYVFQPRRTLDTQCIQSHTLMWSVKAILLNWDILYKGHFTFWRSVKQTRDFSNLIGGEQNFVRSAITLEANSLQNAYMVALFGSFGGKSSASRGNPSSPQMDKLFFLNLYTIYNLYILMDFYLVEESLYKVLLTPRP
jgi:hypothetical protein